MSNRILCCIFVLLATYCNESNSETSLLESELRKWKIIPYSLDVAPPKVLSVKYKDIEVTPGLELFHNQTTEPPQVTWEGNSTDLYTLYFTGTCERDLSWIELMDPRLTTIAIPKSKVLEYELWVVSNIPGNNIANGTVLRAYLEPPRPLPNLTETFLFLLFKQKHFMPPESMRDRRDHETEDDFLVRDFMANFSIGPPIAGNFFFRDGPENMRWQPKGNVSVTRPSFRW